MPVKVAVSSPSFCKNSTLMQELCALPVSVHANTEGLRLTGAALLKFFSQSEPEIILVGTEPINAELLRALPSVKLLAKFGVGLDNIVLPDLANCNVELGWTAGVNKRSVAELVLGFAIGHYRRVIPSVRLMMQGRWVKDGGRQLSNTTLGIIGCGHIGTELATICKPLVKEIFYNDLLVKTEVEAELGIKRATLDQVLRSCDWISFHLPLTADTYHILNRNNLNLLRKDALVINTSRGHVVDYEGVIQALKAGRIGGFATDVYPEEPIDVSPLADLETFYPSPHIGGNAEEAVLAMGRASIDHIRRYAASFGGTR